MEKFKLVRHQPCLLDRLTDDHPAKSEESSQERVVSPLKYREGLLRDIHWLFNSSAHVPEIEQKPLELFEFPNALASGINYGVRQLMGQTSIGSKEIEHRLYNAIRIFEPRINPNTLFIRARRDNNTIICDIEADYWAEPVSLRHLIKTKVDLDTGQVDLSGGSI